MTTIQIAPLNLPSTQLPMVDSCPRKLLFFGTLFFQIWIFNLEEFLSPRSTCDTRVGCPDGMQEEKFREVRCQMDFSSMGSHDSRGTQKSSCHIVVEFLWLIAG